MLFNTLPYVCIRLYRITLYRKLFLAQTPQKKKILCAILQCGMEVDIKKYRVGERYNTDNVQVYRNPSFIF